MRSLAYQILYSDSQPTAHRLIKTLLFLAIAAIVAVGMLETVPTFEQTLESVIVYVRGTAITILTLEFFARLWVAPEETTHRIDSGTTSSDRRGGEFSYRIDYLRSALGLTDLVVVLPGWINLFYPVTLPWFELAAAISLFKLSRYVPALSLVTTVVIRQGRSIFAALVVLGILLVVAATVVYIFENEAQPTLFASIPQSLWWAISTMATVGYGDMYPVTAIGRLIGGLAMLFGIAMFAVPAGILATGFAEELKKRDFVVNWQSVAQVPLFARLDAATIASIAQLLKPRSVSANQAIVRHGDVADSMYFILEGEVEVELTPTPVRLKQGDFFGEIALVEKVRRTATVLSLSDCRLLMLETADFDRLTNQIPKLKESIESISKQRLSGH
jgi:voltage-gated potassium channel